MPATIPFFSTLTNNLHAARSRRRLRSSSSISSLRSSFSTSTSSSSIRSISLGRSSTSSSRSSFALSFFDSTPAPPPPPPSYPAAQSYPPRTPYSHHHHHHGSNAHGYYQNYFHTYEPEIQEETLEDDAAHANSYEAAAMELESFHAARVEQEERLRPRTASGGDCGEDDEGGLLGRRGSGKRWETAEREVRGREREREKRWAQDIEEEKCVWWIGR